jgi:hypothetical protein
MSGTRAQLLSTTVVAMDVSISMASFVGLTGKTRHDNLQQSVANVMAKGVPPSTFWLAFNDKTVIVERPQDGLPPPDGGTDLAGCLLEARRYRPTRLLVISDGEPNDKASALTNALLLSCQISTIFCGDEADRAPQRFLRELAACSRAGMLGTAKVLSLAKPEDTTEEILRIAGPSR